MHHNNRSSIATMVETPLLSVFNLLVILLRHLVTMREIMECSTWLTFHSILLIRLWALIWPRCSLLFFLLCYINETLSISHCLSVVSFIFLAEWCYAYIVKTQHPVNCQQKHETLISYCLAPNFCQHCKQWETLNYNTILFNVSYCLVNAWQCKLSIKYPSRVWYVHMRYNLIKVFDSDDALVLRRVTNGRFSTYTIVLYIISNNYTQRLDGLAQKRNISGVLPKMLQMVTVINPYSAGIDFRRHSLQTSDSDD